MKLYYTSTIEPDRDQNRADMSLGGFKSKTPLPNAEFNNLFSDISAYSVYSQKDEYVGLIMVNDTGVDITDLRLWFVYPSGCKYEVEVAGVGLREDESMETIPTPYSRPLYAEFHKANGEQNAVSLGNIEAGEMLGLWLRRIINTTEIINQETDEYLANNQVDEYGKEDVDIIFDWNVI